MSPEISLSQSDLISIIISTYNRSDALITVLKALCTQTDEQFEVVIADDGSQPETLAAIKKVSWPFAWRHVWQVDEGFRAARIRNRAVANSRGGYIVFLDGDCVPLPSFVAQHRRLSEQNWFVAGNRVLLSERFTTEVIANDVDVQNQTFKYWRRAKKAGNCNRMLPFLQLPLGPCRKVRGSRWKGVKTCNLAMWRRDFDVVGGFDEAYQGWGYEDSDLVIRLLAKGVKRKSGKFAVPVLHLWHKENDMSGEAENAERLRLTKQRRNGQSQLPVSMSIASWSPLAMLLPPLFYPPFVVLPSDKETDGSGKQEGS